MATFQIGDLITFSYPAIHQQGTRAHDKYPQVLILHTNWEGLVHGINFNYLTPDQINTVRMILDPGFEYKHRAAFEKKNLRAVQEVDRINNQAPNSNITSPKDFYERIVRPFLGIHGRRNAPSPPPQKDAYRLYRPEKMSNIRILQRRQYLEQGTNIQQPSAFDKGTNLQSRPQHQQPSIFDKFKQKFQNMKGSRLPKFRKPGDRNDG